MVDDSSTSDSDGAVIVDATDRMDQQRTAGVLGARHTMPTEQMALGRLEQNRTGRHEEPPEHVEDSAELVEDVEPVQEPLGHEALHSRIAQTAVVHLEQNRAERHEEPLEHAEEPVEVAQEFVGSPTRVTSSFIHQNIRRAD